MSEGRAPRALVAGGSGGLGAACVEALARTGFSVTLTCHRGLEAGQRLAAEVQGCAVQVAFPAAAGTLSQLVELASGGPEGSLEALVWAVGPEVPQEPLGDLEPAALARALAVEVEAFHGLLRAALPALRRGSGSVVALTSAGGARFPPGDALSVVPKGAVEALVRGLAREEGKHGVRANAVAVGVIDGGMFRRLDLPPGWTEAALRRIPLGRLGRPEEVGVTVAFLCSRAAAYVTGNVLRVDGGYGV